MTDEGEAIQEEPQQEAESRTEPEVPAIDPDEFKSMKSELEQMRKERDEMKRTVLLKDISAINPKMAELNSEKPSDQLEIVLDTLKSLGAEFPVHRPKKTGKSDDTEGAVIGSKWSGEWK